MDARDIFRKLTKGAKFKREKTDRTSKKAIETPESCVSTHGVCVKTEPEDDISTNVKSVQSCIETASTEITLLGSMTSLSAKRKGKKRKATDDIDVEKKKKMLHQEEVNRLRNQLSINVVGKNVPEPIVSFDELSVKEDLIKNIKSCGFKEPTAIQTQAIPVMLQNRQLLACAPTGSGKTAAFLVPIIHSLDEPQSQGFRALILCPTRELAKQTRAECVRLSQGRNFNVHIISKIGKALTQYGPKSSQKFDILVSTPQRLCFLLKQDPPAISLTNVEWIVIDEADKLFEMGVRSFRDQLQHILQQCTNQKRKIAMFSATYTPNVAKWCLHNMTGLVRITVGQRNSATDLVDQELLFVGNEAGKLLAIDNIIKNGIKPPVLVFVQSKERAEQLYNELVFDGVNIDAMHADRTQAQRDKTVKSFREGKVWILICTEVMARGVDFKGVNLVINYDFPTSAISYIHRVGRAGRAGRRGKAITFFTIEDTVNLRSIAQVIRQSGCAVPEFMLKLKKRSKTAIKKLKVSAPKRESISSTRCKSRGNARRKHPIKNIDSLKKPE